MALIAGARLLPTSRQYRAGAVDAMTIVSGVVYLLANVGSKGFAAAFAKSARTSSLGTLVDMIACRNSANEGPNEVGTSVKACGLRKERSFRVVNIERAFVVFNDAITRWRRHGQEQSFYMEGYKSDARGTPTLALTERFWVISGALR
jgi:hypothetical protein